MCYDYKKFHEVIDMKKKILGGLLVGAFVFGLGAADMSTASASKTVYGQRSEYDGRSQEFGLGVENQFQNLSKTVYGQRSEYDGR